MKKILISLFVLLALTIVGTPGQATVLNFDSWAVEKSDNLLPDPYEGFSWDANWRLSNFVVNPEWDAASHSPELFIFNASGANDLTISRVTAFDFEGAWFATTCAYVNKFDSIKLRGYDGNEWFEKEFDDITIIPQFFSAEFFGVYQVEIEYTLLGEAVTAYFAMDDFTYNEVGQRVNGEVAVPEPGVIFLLGIGLLSILGIRRKR